YPCPLLAKSRRQRTPSITTGIPPTTDIKFSMSAFPRFTSGVGGKAAVVCDRRLRPLLTQSGHGYLLKRKAPTPNIRVLSDNFLNRLIGFNTRTFGLQV
ncbi:MAG: hypothetical protein ACI9W2_004385, partial [Gammaproteobacteria bacterium]